MSDSSDEDTNKIKDRKKQKHPDKPLYHPPKSKQNITKFFSTCESAIKDEEKRNSSPDENDLTWDSLYDDNGDIVNELNNQLNIDNIKPDNLWHSKNDYSKFCENIKTVPQASSDLSNESEYSHILEVYGFSPDLKTRDLSSCLVSHSFKNFVIDWVDDTHALVTFQTSLQASEALQKFYSIMKLRPLSQATDESKLKAKKVKESGLTRKLRPETSAITARRLVIGALGIKVDALNPEQRQAEKEKLRLAKEKKEKKIKAKSLWNDDEVS